MTISVGIIGLGMATKPHMTSLRELEAAGRAKIVGGFAPSPERRRAFAEQWKVPVFDTQDALLTRPDLDLILILHNTRHASSGRRSRRQGRQTHHR